jgi:O-antigen ligase
VGDPNDLAAKLVPAIAIAAFALGAARTALARWAIGSLAAVMAISLFLTESRGGLVGLGAVFCATLVFGGPYRQRALAVFLIVAALGVGYYTQFASQESRERITDFSSSGSAGRSDLWAVGRQIYEDNPVLGVGAGNFQAEKQVYATSNVSVGRIDKVFELPTVVVHNTYLQIMAELGTIGILAFTALVLGALAVGVRAVRLFAQAQDRQLELLGRGLVIGTVGALAAFTFISAEYEKTLWLLLGATAALSALARNARVTTSEPSVASETGRALPRLVGQASPLGPPLSR